MTWPVSSHVLGTAVGSLSLFILSLGVGFAQEAPAVYQFDGALEFSPTVPSQTDFLGLDGAKFSLTIRVDLNAEPKFIFPDRSIYGSTLDAGFTISGSTSADGMFTKSSFVDNLNIGDSNGGGEDLFFYDGSFDFFGGSLLIVMVDFLFPSDTWNTHTSLPSDFGLGSLGGSGLIFVESQQGTQEAPYTFLVSSSTVTVVSGEVIIDIKPGSFPNSINVSSAGVIPVAILSSDTFDASTEVNPDTLALAGATVRVVGKSGKSLCHAEDVNGDTLLDLVCQFQNELDVQVGDSIAVLEGQTFDGTPIRGEDSIRIVPD